MLLRITNIKLIREQSCIIPNLKYQTYKRNRAVYLRNSILKFSKETELYISESQISRLEENQICTSPNLNTQNSVEKQSCTSLDFKISCLVEKQSCTSLNVRSCVHYSRILKPPSPPPPLSNKDRPQGKSHIGIT